MREKWFRILLSGGLTALLAVICRSFALVEPEMHLVFTHFYTNHLGMGHVVKLWHFFRGQYCWRLKRHDHFASECSLMLCGEDVPLNFVEYLQLSLGILYLNISS